MNDKLTSVLITGARGQVGLRALLAWLEAGAEVIAVTRKEPFPLAYPRLRWIKADLEMPESLDMALENFPATVIFTAPIWFLPALMPLFARRGVTHLVAFSSTSVHTKKTSGKSSERALVERLSTSETDVFAAGKQTNIAVTILRPTLIYGVGLDKNVASLARMMRRLPVLPLPLNTRGLRQPVHADDLAKATIKVITNPATAGKAYDVGGSERLPYRALLDRIAARLAKPVRFVRVPGFALMLDTLSALTRKPQLHGEFVRRMGQDMAFDDSAARRDFHWNPRKFLDVSLQPPDTPFF